MANRIVKGKPYPELTMWEAQPYTPEWREFGKHFPFTVPLELFEHCQTHNYPCIVGGTGEYYPIGIGFFNFDIDYFSLLSKEVLSALKEKTLKILFYYHEGDDPYSIQLRLNALCTVHKLSYTCYKFISGNTEADKIPGFIYFPDHELLYWHRNKNIQATPVHFNIRKKDFTALSRTHKWWRATAMADLVRRRLLENSYWSYNMDIVTGQPETDNPIEVDSFNNLRNDVTVFLRNAPYTCDSMSTTQQNNHALIETDHYNNAYFHIILETHFDAGGTNGAFLTEKTFKVIKHGQPFIIVGCPGSLLTLRKLGYRTFDNVIDNRYDDVHNNTERWTKIVSTITQLKEQNLHELFVKCKDDIIHNQNLFLNSKYFRLNILNERLDK